MTSRTYKSGQVPNVGDVVICQDAPMLNATPYFSRIASLSKGQSYTVTAVSSGGTSVLVQVKNNNLKTVSYMANRFNLKKSLGSAKSTEPKKYTILDSTGTSIMGQADDIVALETILSQKLKANPLFEFRVYTYSSTAKTAEPKIQYYRGNPEIIVEPPKHKAKLDVNVGQTRFTKT